MFYNMLETPLHNNTIRHGFKINSLNQPIIFYTRIKPPHNISKSTNNNIPLGTTTKIFVLKIKSEIKTVLATMLMTRNIEGRVKIASVIRIFPGATNI